eukprot:TRINITY_DN67793_c0_g1_i1.p1 TRINITY_DN67793_c0_g1~~TRINITY_DN67793_c0_g1_i1.p1  ORF type:complete len:221 (-),score=37.65 TRINITY_DN67793_c0_g1_i1:140-748(-)
MVSDQSCRVYVGNIDWKVSWQGLKDHMKAAGDVVFADIFEDGNGRSKGVAIVEYKTSEDAKAAINKLHDTMVGSRQIFVREDRESVRAKGSGKGGFKGGYDYDYGYAYGFPSMPLRVGPRDKGRLLYVGNIPFRATWQELKDLFKQEGEVIRVDIAMDAVGRSRGYANVLFEKEEDATKAIEKLNEADFQGRKMMVRLDNYV